MIYRPAKLEDVTHRNVALLAQGMREVDLGEVPPCPVRITLSLHRMIKDSGYLVSIAETKDRELAGVIIGVLTPALFSDATTANMLVWYVRPEFRGPWTGYRLAKIYRDWARMAGADTAYFDVNSGVDNEMAGKIAKKLGFRRIGEGYKATF